MTRRGNRRLKRRLRSVTMAVALLQGAALAFVLLGRPDSAAIIQTMCVLGLLWSLECIRVAIRNPEVFR